MFVCVGGWYVGSFFGWALDCCDGDFGLGVTIWVLGLLVGSISVLCSWSTGVELFCRWSLLSESLGLTWRWWLAAESGVFLVTGRSVSVLVYWCCNCFR
jgi:hypothetical protein